MLDIVGVNSIAETKI